MATRKPRNKYIMADVKPLMTQDDPKAKAPFILRASPVKQADGSVKGYMVRCDRDFADVKDPAAYVAEQHDPENGAPGMPTTRYSGYGYFATTKYIDALKDKCNFEVDSGGHVAISGKAKLEEVMDSAWDSRTKVGPVLRPQVSTAEKNGYATAQMNREGSPYAGSWNKRFIGNDRILREMRPAEKDIREQERAAQMTDKAPEKTEQQKDVEPVLNETVEQSTPAKDDMEMGA